MNDWLYKSAASLCTAIRNKDISSLDLVNACLKRIQGINPKLNAVVQLATDRAPEEAIEMDQAIAHGNHKGPLHGLPISLKDSIDRHDGRAHMNAYDLTGWPAGVVFKLIERSRGGFLATDVVRNI